MGQQCSGEAREAYMREQEQLRSLEESARPVVVASAHALQVKPSVKRVDHPTLRHQQRQQPPPAVFGYAQDVYRMSSTLPPPLSGNRSIGLTGTTQPPAVPSGSGNSTQLTNANGSFTDPKLIDKYYDVSVSHLLLAAEQGASSAAPGSIGASYVNSSLGPVPASWQSLQAIPYPAHQSLAPLPYSAHANPNMAGSASYTDEPNPSAMNSLRWKPKFSKAVTSITKEDNAKAEKEKMERKAQRAKRRMEKEEKERHQAELMKEMRRQVLEGTLAEKQRNEEKEAPSSDALSFSYVRDEASNVDASPASYDSSSDAASVHPHIISEPIAEDEPLQAAPSDNDHLSHEENDEFAASPSSEASITHVPSSLTIPEDSPHSTYSSASSTHSSFESEPVAPAPAPAAELTIVAQPKSKSAATDDFSAFLSFNQTRASPPASSSASKPVAGQSVDSNQPADAMPAFTLTPAHSSAPAQSPPATAALYTYGDEGQFEDEDFNEESVSRKMDDDELFADSD